MVRKTKLCLGIAVVAVAAGIPWLVHAHHVTPRNGCLQNLRMLTGPMTCCVPLSMNLKNGDKMESRDVLGFFKNAEMPRCPTGGKYMVSWIVGGPPPKCSLHGDLLWAGDHVKTLTELEEWHDKPQETGPASFGGAESRGARVLDASGK